MKHRFLHVSLGTLIAIAWCTVLPSWAEDQKTGHPDLSGMWNGGGGLRDASDDNGNIVANFPSRRCAPNQRGCGDQTNQNVDGEFTGRMDPNRPLYKPEFWDKVQDLDRNTNTVDPLFKCQPYGVPRMGPPTKIVQTSNEVIFLYAAPGAGTQPHDYRIIPTDGRGHDPVRAQDITYYGDSIGRWESDTLVIDSVGFNDITWLDRGGYFHTDNMHVIEKLWREGNTLSYQVTIDDPGVLLEPWVMTTRKLKLNNNPKAYIHEGDPCRDVDYQNMVSRIRH
jgi:hypothetical protein